MTPDLALLMLLSCLLSCGGTWGIRKYALKRNLLDIPNQRSSHNVPVPRGGGIAILFSFYLGGAYLLVTGRLDIPEIVWLSGCCLAVAIIGFLDDLFQISAAKRFVVHLLSAVIAVHFFIATDALLLPWGSKISLFLIQFLLVLAIVWLLNLFNFMDGIDGLASSETISVALGAGGILYLKGETEYFLPLLFILSASSFGFLVWNWPPAKIFMGDACSGFLGFCFGIIALLTSLSTSLSIMTWAILLGAFVVDATVTLVMRILRGEKFYQAHRSHAYQILSRRVGSHLKVTALYTGINWLFLFPLACASVFRPEYGWILLIFSYSLLTIFCMVTGAGTTND